MDCFYIASNLKASMAMGGRSYRYSQSMKKSKGVRGTFASEWWVHIKLPLLHGEEFGNNDSGGCFHHHLNK